MKPFAKLIFVFVLSITLFSCGKKTIFETSNPMPNKMWNHFKPQVFDFEIKDSSKIYQVTLSMKLNSNMTERIIPICISMSYPNGESRADNLYLFTDSATKENGNSNFVIQSYKTFNNSGKYHYEITQNTSKYNLEGVEAIGFNVKIIPPRKNEEE
jgi:gliding motility-associated lipoprotein GldH